MGSCRLSRFLFGLGFGLAPLSVSGQPVVYVDGSAGGADDGSSWCDAFVHLQDALTAASGGGIAEVRVADGVYWPDRGSANPGGTGDRNAAFHLINGVAVKGGYAGCGAANPDVRDIAVFETVLSGDLSGDDVLLADESACTSAGGTWYGVLCSAIQNNGENSYQVVVSVSNDSTAVLDGFTVSSGNGNGVALGATPDSREQGSAVNIYSGTPHLRNCRFVNCRVDNHGAVNDHGGATITDCAFEGNFATQWGGALHVHTGVTTTVTGSAFDANATAGAGAGGGAILVKGVLVMSNSTVTNSRSGARGGAIYVDALTHVTMTDCLIRQNRSAGEGGGIYNVSAGLPSYTRVAFEDNATMGGTFTFGGGVYNGGLGSLQYQDCSFTGNTAFRLGGAMYNEGTATVTVVDTVFTGNAAEGDVATRGGAMYNNGAEPVVTDCEFYGNRVVGTNASGGAIYNTNNAPTLLRCLFDGNESGRYGGGVYNIDSSTSFSDCAFLNNTAVNDGAAVYYRNTSTPSITDSLFVGNSAGVSGGAVFAYIDVGLSIDRCRFALNTARDGGALWLNTLLGSVSNSLFVGNEAVEGYAGSVHVGNTQTPVTNCTFYGNSAFNGGGVVGYSTAPITNCIFWQNTDDGGMDDTAQIVGNIEVNNCLVQGWTGLFGGSGNFGADPLFLNVLGPDGMLGTVDDDFRILPGSPARNVGDNGSVVGAADLGGSPRIDGGSVDLGAYEMTGTCPDSTCDPGENSCTCPSDCGAPPSTELACDDGLDDDCDVVIDCADADCNADPTCDLNNIPTVSQWGLIVMTAVLGTAGTLVLRRRAALEP